VSLIALALAAALSPAQPDPETDADLRCVAVIAMQIGTMPDGEAKTQMSSGLMYFIGRIDGRSPGFDLEAGMVALVKSQPAPAVIAADQKRCGDMLVKRGTSLVDMGARMQQMH
jgi:hypothetical protein